jgi:hypothetical protein
MHQQLYKAPIFSENHLFILAGSGDIHVLLHPCKIFTKDINKLFNMQKPLNHLKANLTGMFLG